MEFKPDKCELLRITRKRNKLIFPCTLHNKELGTIDATKYLGVLQVINIGKKLTRTRERPLRDNERTYNVSEVQPPTTPFCE
jgi:hypothetical protein